MSITDDSAAAGLVQEEDLVAGPRDQHAASAASHGEIRTYPVRWAMVVLFGLCSAVNAMLWITFSPINTVTQAFFGINAAKVNSLSIVYMAAYVPFSLVSNWFFLRFGNRAGMILGSGLNLLSAVVRLLAAESNDGPRSNGFVILLLGQSIGAIAQPLLTNMPAKVAAVWFPVAERDIATVICSLFNPVGIAVGSIVPTIFVAPDQSSIRMFDLLLMETIVGAVVLGLVFLFFRDKPPLPPSHSESSKKDVEASHVFDEIRAVMASKHFRILFVLSGVGLGFFNAITTLVELLVSKSGYSVDDAALFSGLLLGCGLLNAIVVGILLDRWHAYNKTLRVSALGASAVLVVLLLLLRPDMTAAISAAFAVLGALMLPLLPVAFECAVECTYPVSEEISTGLLMSAGQIGGIVFILVLGPLIDAQPDFTEYVFEPAYIITAIIAVVFGLGAQVYNGPTLRLDAENAADVNDLTP